ncbi:MAG: spore coat associated protein CotJA [Eubacteriales bacterium]|nr:spore coat associated protein CotJA [Eubacteriales bacterium]
MNNSYMPVDTPLAMSYVPWQTWGDLYEEETALVRGTIFPVLDLPFLARRDAR